VGVKKILSTKVIMIRSFAFWLLGNIVYQEKHREKFAVAFDSFCPILINATENLPDFIGPQFSSSGEEWFLLLGDWWNVAVSFLLLNVSFARKVDDHFEFQQVLKRRGMTEELKASRRLIEEVDEELLREERLGISF
jgi:hypothetical protein